MARLNCASRFYSLARAQHREGGERRGSRWQGVLTPFDRLDGFERRIQSEAVQRGTGEASTSGAGLAERPHAWPVQGGPWLGRPWHLCPVI